MASENKLRFGIAAVVCLVRWSAPTAVLAADEPPVTTTPAAEAQTEATSQADVLFQDGKRLLEEGKLVEACEKLAQSDALDPAIGTLGLLAACHEQQGRTATAFQEYQETASRADRANDERGAFARERARALAPDLSRLTIRLAKTNPSVVVMRNGLKLSAEQLGVALPVDPGTYEIVARYPDKPEFRTTLSVGAKKSAEVEVPDPYAAPPSKAPPLAPTLSPRVEPRGFATRKIVTFASAGVGAVGLGLSAAFALSASSKNAASLKIEQVCATPSACAEGRALREDAFSSAMAANIAFGLGAAGATTAFVMVLVNEIQASNQPRSTGLHYVVLPNVALGSKQPGVGITFVGTF